MRYPRTVVALLAVVTPLRAQQSAPESPPAPPSGRSLIERVSRPGKWIAGAAAVGLIVLGAREHDRAQESWDALLVRCREDNERCETRPDGSYQDPAAEELSQEAAYYDRRAHLRIAGGQVAVIAAGAMFILDLSARRGKPKDVPFDPDQTYVAPARGGGVLLGWRVRF